MTEQMIYVIGTLLVIDLIVIIAAIVPYLFGAKIGYRWRKILWLVLAVRLLIPVRLILNRLYAEKPLYFVQVEIPQLYASEDMLRGEDETVTEPGQAAGAADPSQTETGSRGKIDAEGAGKQAAETGSRGRIDAEGAGIKAAETGSIERIDAEGAGTKVTDASQTDTTRTDTGEINSEGANIKAAETESRGRIDAEGAGIKVAETVSIERIDAEGAGIQAAEISQADTAQTDTGEIDVEGTEIERVDIEKNSIGKALQMTDADRWLLLALWVLVGFALTEYHVIGFVRIKELLRIRSRRCEEPESCDLLAEICREYKLRSVPQVWICEDLSSPMLFGYRRTRLLMPDRRYTEAELDMIFRHELQHKKSGDLWYKLLIMLVCDLYWFNPVLVLMQKLAYQDVECVCDTRVIHSLPTEERKIYGNIVLDHMTKNSARDIVYGTSIFTGMRAAKLRIKNMFAAKNKWGYAILGILILCAVAGSSVWVIKGQQERTEIITEAEQEDGQLESPAEEDKTASVTFRVDDLDVVRMKDEFDLTDYYITNKVIVSNRYYIDENNVLWGYGRNDYGQLGISDVNVEDFYEEPVKIAADVVSVDCSTNGYFCVYLTEDGRLYGLGSNLLGLLGAEQDGEILYHAPVTEPALLMENVAYARAGMESIAALDRDGNAWWWGQFCGNYHTWVCDDGDYSSVVENDKNPAKMFYIHPKKILENCIYVTTGYTMGAAISEDGSLYTWGRNLFGECGTPVTEDDFVRTPQKVLEHVRMVWVEKIAFGSQEEEIPEIGRYDTSYGFNLFAQLEDGTLLGVGKDLGDKEKEIAVTGDLVEKSTGRYSDTFVPIALEELSEPALRQRLGGLTWGMSAVEVREFLTDNGLQYFETFVEGYSIAVEDCRYYCYFDERGRLNRILLQEGGSRDRRFEMGMTLEEVRAYFDGELSVTEEDEYGIYWASGRMDATDYGFGFADDVLSAVYESEP